MRASIRLCLLGCAAMLMLGTRALVTDGSSLDAEATAASLVEYWTYPPEELDQSGAQLGAAVSSAGDIDSDGYGDVLIGAPLGQGEGEEGIWREGVVHVFRGSPTGLPEYATLTLASGQQGARFGASISIAGDVNRDGYDDVIVGAPGWSAGTQLSEAGATFVYHGSDSTLGLSVTPDWSFFGEQKEDALGLSVSGAGDVDGDGYDDVLVGAPYYGDSNAGRAYIFYGSVSGLLTDTIQIIDSYDDQATAWFGHAVAGAGDVNGDGFADVLVGAPYYQRNLNLIDEGAVFLYLGSQDGVLTTPSWQAYGDQAGAFFGWAVGSAGDLDSDGYVDVAAGAPMYDDDEENQGLVRVYHGGESGLANTPDWSYTHAIYHFRLGTALGSAGDVNADGYGDLIVGAPSDPPKTEDPNMPENVEEAALIFLGSPAGLGRRYTWYLRGYKSNSNYGLAVAGVGHTNDDEYDDIVVGAPQYRRSEDKVGQAYGYLGAIYEPFRTFLPLVLHAAP